jgi:hypothetical protein
MSRLNQLSALMAAFPGEVSHPAQFAKGILNSDTHSRVMNAYTVGNPAGIAGAGFTVDVYEQISSRAYDVKYPEILWSQFMPSAGIDTSISPGARFASARVNDWRGKGAFRAAVGKDIPTVDVSMGKITVPLEAGGVSAHVDMDELRSVAFGFEGMNLLTAKGAAMRLAYERHREQVFFYGYSGLGFQGYIATANVPTTTAATKAATGTTWAVATPAEIVKDVITAITTIVTNTNDVFRPNRIALPLAQWLQISGMNIGGTAGSLQNESVMSYLKRTLPEVTGQAVEIVALRYLSGAGAGATNRMVVETVNADTFYLPDSVPFNMLPPQDDQYSTRLFADYKFGGLLRPFPTSALYMDGI